MAMDANKVINGLYGFVYDENGAQLDSTQEFRAELKFDKQTISIPGVFLKGHKVTGGDGTGKMNFLKIDSRLQSKIAANPSAKYNYTGKLKDPTADGHEAVMLIGVSFDGTPLTGFKMNELQNIDLAFTFDDYEFLEKVEGE